MIPRLGGSVALATLLLALHGGALAQKAQDFGGLFTKVADISVGERTSRFDYQSIDPELGRLFIAKMGSAKLLVFDIRKQAVVAELEGFPKTTGVLAVPTLHRVYASVPGAGVAASVSVALGMTGLSSGSGALAVLDSSTLKEIARLPAGVFPDGIAFDPDDKRIFVSDELGKALTVIDADRNKVIGRIDLGGEVGNVQYDPVTKKVYAPVQSRNELAVVDPSGLKLETRFALPGGKNPHGLRLARGLAIAYAACDENDKLLVVDLKARKVLDVLPLGRDPDVLADDPALHRLYVASESGTLSVFDITDAPHPKKIGDVFVAGNAHSVAVDPVSHNLFLPLRDLGGKAVMRILAPAAN
jgi:DNA-binding beta-propeller fold protein YncE